MFLISERNQEIKAFPRLWCVDKEAAIVTLLLIARSPDVLPDSPSGSGVCARRAPGGRPVPMVIYFALFRRKILVA